MSFDLSRMDAALGDGVDVQDCYGSCPVQAEGTVDGVTFYFRARGDVSLSIGGDDVISAPDWYTETAGPPVDGYPGYMEEAAVTEWLRAGFAEWRAGKASQAILTAEEWCDGMIAAGVISGKDGRRGMLVDGGDS